MKLIFSHHEMVETQVYSVVLPQMDPNGSVNPPISADCEDSVNFLVSWLKLKLQYRLTHPFTFTPLHRLLSHVALMQSAWRRSHGLCNASGSHGLCNASGSQNL